MYDSKVWTQVKDPGEYYDAMAEKEWQRLVKDPYHKLEFEVTMHFLREYLPEEGRVLDAGGGPGRYAIKLAEMGYEVVLQDISPVQLEIAKQKITRRRREIRDRILDVVEGTITDLSEFESNSFDSVLCLGPLSHLKEEDERRTAARELVRVVKKASPIFVSAIGRFGVFRTVLQSLPGELTDPSHQSVFTEGVHHGHKHAHALRKYRRKKMHFPDAYFFLPEELPVLFEQFGVKSLVLASCEGLSAHLQRATNSLHADKERWARWFQLLLDTCTDPSIVGVGEHLLYVGRKL